MTSMVQQSFISNAVSSAGSTTSPSAPRKWPGPSLGRLQRHGANNYHYYFAQVQVQQEQEQIYQSVQEQRRTESQERLKAVEAALADEKAKSARLEAELKTALAANKLAPTPVLLSSSSPSPSQNREWAVVSADEERMVLSVLEQIDQIQPTSGWSYLYNRNKEICGVRYSGICFTEFNISAFVTDDLRFVEWFTLDNMFKFILPTRPIEGRSLALLSRRRPGAKYTDDDDPSDAYEIIEEVFLTFKSSDGAEDERSNSSV